MYANRDGQKIRVVSSYSEIENTDSVRRDIRRREAGFEISFLFSDIKCIKGFIGLGVRRYIFGLFSKLVWISNSTTIIIFLSKKKFLSKCIKVPAFHASILSHRAAPRGTQACAARDRGTPSFYRCVDTHWKEIKVLWHWDTRSRIWIKIYIFPIMTVVDLYRLPYSMKYYILTSTFKTYFCIH